MLTSEQQLKSLECRIDQLIEVCEKLHSENSMLRHRQSNQDAAQKKLMVSNDMAKSHVESMILRLKTMEQSD
ncbi:MAG: TIGR02449 family protein [Gammaproteobacteria bacterium]|nr:TIGR02449 family protein [Gammaproteobacteria bacterium]